MMSGTPNSRGGQAADVVEAVGFVCLTCLCVAAGFALALNSADASASHRPLRIDDSVNPNDASAASLARLPNVGPSRARQIVSYRGQWSGRGSQAPAFRRAEDLREITGIGPATIEAVRPWLSFD
jgi:competence ComEA-like helix-hairpin-helix protein